MFLNIHVLLQPQEFLAEDPEAHAIKFAHGTTTLVRTLRFTSDIVFELTLFLLGVRHLSTKMV